MHPIRVRWLALPLCLAWLAPLESGAQSDGGYADYLDWIGWARVVPQVRPGLASSWDRTGGNIDADNYESPPGRIFGDLDVTAATILGPGIIYRFWMPHRTATTPFAVRMYFDGETTPRIDTDSQQILDGAFSYFTGPLVDTFAGGQVCYEPIPFRESVRIDTENRSGVLHYYHYTYLTFPPGTEVSSWNGTLDAGSHASRLATITMLQDVGQHPAGPSSSAQLAVVGPTLIPPGDAIVLADLSGPGMIRRLNVRMDGAADQVLDGLRLQMFWDDEPAAVDVPVGWFFGAGHDRVPYRSLVMGTDSADGFYCFWPMPYHESARIVLSNPTPDAALIGGSTVEYESGPQDSDLGYLHALAREKIANPAEFTFAMAEMTGTGHYVGNFLSVEQDLDSHYMLEGDDVIVVDHVRTLHGTGLEDAYNGGYYYNWVSNPMEEPEGPSPSSAIRPLSGILRVERTASPPFARADQYRWMIADRVPFVTSLELSIETRYSNPGSRWKSVVFWYQLSGSVTSVPPGIGSTDHLDRLELRVIAPNPATDEIRIRFGLPADGRVSLDLLDAAGRRIRTLIDEPISAGAHEVRWSRSDEPNGVYFVRLRHGGQSVHQKLTLAR
ncbi:MAG: DUF2961 domain-containing protein [Candidatus Eisenbacteria bacterium]